MRTLLILLAIGAGRIALGMGPVEEVGAPLPKATTSLGVFMLMRAFASGCSAMTGTEAISDGVPAFQEPQARNAITTLIWMVAILGTGAAIVRYL